MKIVLLGYMASGKSLIGKRLAEVLKCDFIDLDDYIEKKEQKSISEIFSQKGEIYFRKLESLALIEVLNTNKKSIIALGGGTPCYGNNMEVILNSENTNVLYLKVSISTIVDRLMKEKAKRPLVNHLKTKDELTEFVGKHLFERSPFYSQARQTINANKCQEEIIEEIISCLF